MEQVYFTQKDCCGCTACQSNCPQNAITMETDREGFLYPVIDSELCVDCNLCRVVCPFINSESQKNTLEQTVYSCVHKDEDALRHSTSGGAFTAISDVILGMGGVVYGADFDADYNIYHSRAINTRQRDRQRVSKYAQSDLEGCFEQVKHDLQNGKTVLFTGTPCQIAGLKSFIPDNLEGNLYLCDLICHSIPSPLIWQEYKAYQENKYGGKMTKVMFRSKIHPWTRDNSNRGFIFEVNNDGTLHEDNIFYDLFFKVGTITRPSCANCKFTSVNRVGDITIADYWGIEEYDASKYNPLGVSVVITNNPKGEKLAAEMAKTANLEQRDFAEQKKHQKRLAQPVEFPEYRDAFWDDLLDKGFAYVMDKCVYKKDV
ncbi:MAG: Coenzyme F420 hydrogenase/dehydrogenase, beta subunit C-terminal domain [Oscillospiraceae bacterium]|nr:Coenzyme F420 hydrogenase/dehydrogenase, beta subunit C-terminal domain [Oscillospiraceae bacterium]